MLPHDQSQDRAVDHPVSVADHETDAKCEIEALEYLNHPHQDHGKPDQATDNPHRRVKCPSTRGPLLMFGSIGPLSFEARYI